MDRPLILIANTNQGEVETMGEQLRQEGYETLSAVSIDELDKALSSKKKYALAIIDVAGFDERIWEACSRVQEARVPFIVIAPQRSPVIQRNSMNRGAAGLLVKPLAARELIEHIHSALGD